MVRTEVQVNSALHPSRVAKSSTSFGWGKGGKVTNAGWQVTLCDLIWHVISRSGVVISITNCYIRFTLLCTLLFLLQRCAWNICFVAVTADKYKEIQEQRVEFALANSCVFELESLKEKPCG